jgi:hypothetical protein
LLKETIEQNASDERDENGSEGEEESVDETAEEESDINIRFDICFISYC